MEEKEKVKRCAYCKKELIDSFDCRMVDHDFCCTKCYLDVGEKKGYLKKFRF